MAGLELWWLGQAGFRLRDPAGGPTVFVDPFLTAREDRAWQAPIGPASLAQADVVLVTHEHTDHLDRPALEAAAGATGSHFTLVLPAPLVDVAIAEIRLAPERVVGARPGQRLDVAGVVVDPVPARHGVDVADAYTFGEELPPGLVRYLGYVIGVGGLRVYHAGDCVPYAGQAEALRRLAPRVALLPINGRDFFREAEHNIVGNMDHREAARLAADIGAEVVVPMHWEMFATNRGAPDQLVRYVAAHFPHLSVVVPGRGAPVRLS